MNAPANSPPLTVAWSHGLRRGLREALCIVLIALLAATATHFVHPRAPQWFAAKEPLAADEVTLDMIREKWRGEVLWIDARTRTAHAAGHIPDALLLNEQEADALMFEHIEKLQNNQRPVVVYCDGHACQASRKIAAYLRERMPAAEVYVLRGGWKAWTERKE